MTEFQIRQDAFTTTRLVETTSDRDAADGEVVVKIDRFAVTSNNVTYAAAGVQLGYWKFFPPSGDADGWGLMPVWGFGDVIASSVEHIAVGERLFGYWPPATHLRLQPSRVAGDLFFDGAEHRAALPAGYNIYRRVQAEPGYDRSMDALRMLLWPLFVTSFCLWDAMQDNDWYGAQQIVLVSASSKTSIGLAYALAGDDSAPPVIGLTSSGNLDLVTGLGLYRSALTYDALDEIDARVPTVIVDMSGNREVLGRLHRNLGDQMKKTINVGLTHWDHAAKGEGIIAERSEFFFAPSHIQQRIKDWGPEGFASKSSKFVVETAAKTRDWLKVESLEGLQGLSDVFEDLCRGRVAPDRGLIVELPD